MFSHNGSPLPKHKYSLFVMHNLEMLNIDVPEHVVKATDYIDKMIEFVKILEQKGGDGAVREFIDCLLENNRK